MGSTSAPKSSSCSAPRARVSFTAQAPTFSSAAGCSATTERSSGVPTALGSDVGAGTSLCLLDVIRDVYSVQMTQGTRPSVGELLYMATQAGAELLGLGDDAGSFAVGKRADFVVLRPIWDDLFAARWAQCESMEDQFFAAALLGGTSAIASTTIAGRTTWSPG